MTADDRGGDADMLRRACEPHLRAMANVAYRYERDARDVEEIVADALELAHRNRARLSTGTEAQVRSWLLRTVRYLSANHVRRAMTRNQAFQRLAREPLDLVASPEDEYIATEREEQTAEAARHVAEVLDRLDARYRTALVMSALGSSSAEIGQAIGASAGAARKVLHRAREAFRLDWSNGVSPPESQGSRHDG